VEQIVIALRTSQKRETRAEIFRPARVGLIVA